MRRLLLGLVVAAVAVGCEKPPDGPVAADTNRSQAKPKAVSTSAPVLEVSPQKDITLKVLWAKRLPQQQRIIIAVYLDYDEKFYRHSYRGTIRIVANGQRYQVISSDEFHTGSQTGGKHKILEWEYEYKQDDNLANVNSIDLIAEYAFRENVPPLHFKGIPVVNVAHSDDTTVLIPFGQP